MPPQGVELSPRSIVTDPAAAGARSVLLSSRVAHLTPLACRRSEQRGEVDAGGEPLRVRRPATGPLQLAVEAGEDRLGSITSDSTRPGTATTSSTRRRPSGASARCTTRSTQVATVGTTKLGPDVSRKTPTRTRA
jgi:hypothetical protein